VVPFPLGFTRPGDDDRHFLLDAYAERRGKRGEERRGGIEGERER
jgi:hypothetical protein